MVSRRLLKHWSARSRVALCAFALIAAVLPSPALAIGGTGSISGTVYNAAGSPAADVYVQACTTSCQTAFTAANGTYTITGLDAGTYRIGIEDFSGTIAGGYATVSGVTTDPAAALLVGVAGTPVIVDVHATAGLIVGGAMTAQAGGPVSGVFVEACLVVAPSAASDFTPCGIAPTSTDGTYSLSVLPGAYRVFVEDLSHVVASGYYAATGYVFATRLATIITVGTTNVTGISMAIPPGAAIAGTVTDSLGAPLEGITAEACLTSDLLACGVAYTAADGSYSVTGLPLGSYDVIFKDVLADHPGGYYGSAGFTAESAQAAVVTVGASGATGIDVKLPIGYLVSGVVTNAVGTPARVEISDCTVKICMFVMTTNADGSYAINLAPGKHYLHVADESGANLSGYYSTGGVANGGHATALTVASADISGINLKLRKIVGSIHPGTTHSGKYATSTVVVKGTYATARFNLGKTFAGTRVAILRAVKSSTGAWSTYKKVATVVVAADGYAYYSARVSGSLGFKASESDLLVPAVQVTSAPVYVRSK